MTGPEYGSDAWSKLIHCLECGAVVYDKDAHTRWHRELDQVAAGALR